MSAAYGYYWLAKEDEEIAKEFQNRNKSNARTETKDELNHFGLGIDLGVKEFAVIRNGMVKKNINKTATIRKSEKQGKREQRCLSRKYEDLKKRKKRRGEATGQNIQKQVIHDEAARKFVKIFNISTWVCLSIF